MSELMAFLHEHEGTLDGILEEAVFAAASKLHERLASSAGLRHDEEAAQEELRGIASCHHRQPPFQQRPLVF
jgi:hypothetical protein